MSTAPLPDTAQWSNFRAVEFKNQKARQLEVSLAELTIPRFGSIRETDPDYDPVLVRMGPRIDVVVDGKPTSKVIAYNCDQGWVRRFITDARGKIRFFATAPLDRRVREETLTGRVTVRWR